MGVCRGGKRVKILYCDIETYSSADLKRTGAVKYAETEDFEILLMSYAFDDDPIQVWDFTKDGPPSWLAWVLTDPTIVKMAWNISFERSCFNQALGIYTPPEQWTDIMTLAAMNGLPMSLEAAGEALQITQQKLSTGKALINYFCKPCKATIANGGRTRNLPHHNPGKWEDFKTYCGVDTEAERLIHKRLQRFPVPDFERELEAVDARSNERGVLSDLELAEAAVFVDEKLREEHTEELRRLTGLDNPNSVAQLKDWLATVGVDCDSLDKNTVQTLRETLPDPTTKRVLELRQLLGKTSTKKYQAILDSACKDHRVRGLLQYYGAGRTGRWAGRRVQLQNLAQNHLADIGEVRELVRSRDLETLELCYDSVPDVLSQLIRTAFIAKEGHTFLVADYSAIEARVIAYLAGEQWRMDVFANGGDIYCSSASQMFKVPVEKHGVNGHLRQKGKVAELACIAEGQEVLTDKGLVPIEKVTTDMKVWDGIEWVIHDGVVYKGEKEVITYEGLTATADHIVWVEVEGQQRTIRLGDATACGAHLIQTGDGRKTIRVGRDNQSREEMERIVEPLLRTDKMHRMRSGAMARNSQPHKRKVQGVPTLHRPTSCAKMVIQTLHSRETEMHKPKHPKLQRVWGARNLLHVRLGKRSLPIHDRKSRASIERYGNRPNRQQWQLRAWELEMGTPTSEPRQSTIDCATRMAPGRMAILANGSKAQTLTGHDPRANHNRRQESGRGETQRVAQHSSKVRVYDILNAGPRHRFTVSNVLVHNCGYGGGVAALKAFGAEKMGLTEAEMQDIVTQWRLASPTIPRLWRRIEDAARAALENPGRRCAVLRKYQDVERAKRNEALTGGRGYSQEFLAGGSVCTFWRDKDALRCKLPSGRILTYWQARLDTDGKICFMGQNQTTRKWERTDTWGGKLVENVVQAFARDCLAVAILRLEKAGFKICFHVHDEIVAEAPDGSRWEDMAEIMGRPIDWAPGLLLRADGYDTKFYMKD